MGHFIRRTNNGLIASTLEDDVENTDGIWHVPRITGFLSHSSERRSLIIENAVLWLFLYLLWYTIEYIVIRHIGLKAQYNTQHDDFPMNFKNIGLIIHALFKYY